MTLRTLGTNTAVLGATYAQPLGKTTTGAAAPLTYYNALDYGAFGNGIADDAAALQSAIDAASTAGGGVVRIPKGTYNIGATLNLPSHVSLEGGNTGPFVGGPVTILWVGASGGTMIAPKNTAIDTKNWRINNVRLMGGSLAAIAIRMYRVSNSELERVHISGLLATTGVGIVVDANVSNQAYFNSFRNCIISGAGGAAAIRFQNGANVNHWYDGAISGSTNGFEFLSLSAGNVVIGCDLEDVVTSSIYCDAPSNVFIGNHIERCVNGYSITASANYTRINGTSYGAVTNRIVDASKVGVFLDETAADQYAAKIGSVTFEALYAGASTRLDMDPTLGSGTAAWTWYIGRNTNTAGTKTIVFTKGNGTSTPPAAILNLGDRTWSFGDVSLGGGKGVEGLENASTVPSSNPAGGYVRWSQLGVMRMRTSSGTITTVGGDVVAKSANYTLGVADRTCLVTTGASTITITLPAATQGARYEIKKVDAGAGTVTVATTSSQTIDGSTTKSLAAQYDKISVVSDGTAWFIS